MKLKSWAILIALIAIIGFGVLLIINAQTNPPLEVHGECDSNPNTENVEFYIFYVWQGNFQNLWSESSMDTLEVIPHVNTDSLVFSNPFFINRDWVRLGAKAFGQMNYTRDKTTGAVIDSFRDGSDMSLTRFYHYNEFAPPSDPDNPVVEKDK